MPDAKEAALKFLKNKDRTEQEIVRFLKKNGWDQVGIEDTLEYLKALHYVDDYQYAVNFLEMSMDRNRGPLRIARELSAKGIVSHIIEDAMYEVMPQEWERNAALRISDDIQSKNPSLSNEKLLAKIVNKLSYEGFNEEVINDMAEEFDSSAT